ncbi:MAG: hypothetical protein DI537_14450 [Stutzerimonas stutzeri]|nr:MAG: hypothetical protein DI537_14450 [Stutzerimonas stutzeri]
MWINLDKDQLELVKATLSVMPQTHPVTAGIIRKIDETIADAAEPGGWADKARELYGEDGKVEIDGDAVVSTGEDPGAYVMAWVWVTEDEMGISAECEGCGERHPTGVLEDGFCPACCDQEDDPDYDDQGNLKPGVDNAA